MGEYPNTCPAGYYWSKFDEQGQWQRVFKATLEELIESACIPVEPGYYSPNGAIKRTACPDGYTSAAESASVDDCYMEIAPGYYWTGSAVELCPARHACAGGNMPYADRVAEWGTVVCSGNGVAVDYPGMAYCGCPIDPLDGKKGKYVDTWCYKMIYNDSGTYSDVNEYTTANANCFWNGTNYAKGGTNTYGCDTYSITACAAGYYAPTTYIKHGLINCIPAETGYYSSEGATDRTACPDGQTTIGYGPGADEAADCGHELHIGDATVHLRSEKRTTPALHVKIGDDIFYGDMSTERKGHLRVKIGDTVYSVFDDSM